MRLTRPWPGPVRVAAGQLSAQKKNHTSPIIYLYYWVLWCSPIRCSRPSKKRMIEERIPAAYQFMAPGTVSTMVKTLLCRDAL